MISGITIGGDIWNSFCLKKIRNDCIIELENTPITYKFLFEVAAIFD
ncbi:MAG: hypothetical protein V3V14_14185 [Saprospiraceae bacterium]